MSEPDLGFVHRFAPAPQDTEQPAPALLLLHGTGGNEDDLLPLGRALAPEWALLSTRGKILEGGAPRFFRRLAEGVFDVDDLIARTHELADFVEAAAPAYGIDPGRVVAVGYSNGANIAASLMLLHPGVLAGGVLLRAMVPLQPDPLPDLSGTKAIVLSGRQDRMIPAASAQRLPGLLREAGAEVDVHLEDTGHGLTQNDLAASRAWLAERFSA